AVLRLKVAHKRALLALMGDKLHTLFLGSSADLDYTSEEEPEKEVGVTHEIDFIVVGDMTGSLRFVERSGSDVIAPMGDIVDRDSTLVLEVPESLRALNPHICDNIFSDL